MSVPTVPIAKWREDGTPDFTHLEGGDTVQEQLQTLISRKNGRVVRIDTDHFYFEVEGKVHEQRYVVENGKAALDGNSKEAGPEFEVLSRRRIGKAGVPPMPTTDQE